MVRVPATQYHFIARPLDVGAMGLMVPMVESAEQARIDRRFGQVPAGGRRGAAFGVAHDDYTGGDIVAKMDSANDEVLLIAQIETARGVENVERSRRSTGSTCLWIGHFDLTNSLGIPGQFAHPTYLEAVERVLEACQRHGKAPGIMAGAVADGQALAAAGVPGDGLLRRSLDLSAGAAAGNRRSARDALGQRRTTRPDWHHRRALARADCC